MGRDRPWSCRRAVARPHGLTVANANRPARRGAQAGRQLRAIVWMAER